MIGLGVLTAEGAPSLIGMATGVGIGASVNSGAKAMARVTGALTFGTGLLPGLWTNVGGSLAGPAYKGENPNTGIAGAAAGSVLGFLIGGKLEGAINNKLNPWYEPTWIDLGLGISKPLVPSALPSLLHHFRCCRFGKCQWRHGA